MDLQFKYAAIGIFRDDANGITELRVIIVDESRRAAAFDRAEQMMKAYARDFRMEFFEPLNVFEAGTDMIAEYGEVYSVTWKSDPDFEDRLAQKLDEDT